MVYAFGPFPVMDRPCYAMTKQLGSENSLFFVASNIRFYEDFSTGVVSVPDDARSGIFEKPSVPRFPKQSSGFGFIRDEFAQEFWSYVNWLHSAMLRCLVVWACR